MEGSGAGAEEWIGKRVVAIPGGAFGGYAELAVGPAAMAFEMPPASQLADTTAAALYFPFHLSWLALHERARLQAGDTFLFAQPPAGSAPPPYNLASVAGARVIATAGIRSKARPVPVPGRLGRHQLQGRRFRRGGAPGNERTWGRRGVRLGRGRGHDPDVSVHGVQRTAPVGRLRVPGYRGEDEGIIPWPVLFGNFSLFGVCHAYVDDPCGPEGDDRLHLPLPRRRGTLPRSGSRTRCEQAACGPSSGSEVAFTDLPQALQAMADRQTVGRNVALVTSSKS